MLAKDGSSFSDPNKVSHVHLLQQLFAREPIVTTVVVEVNRLIENLVRDYPTSVVKPGEVVI
jgi:hypothetical protein